MADARSYRPGGTTATGGAPSSSVDPSFVDPQTYEGYLSAARADALSPDSLASQGARLAAVVQANPGITPDAAAAAALSGLPANHPAVQQIQGMSVEQRAQQIAQQIQQGALERQRSEDTGAYGLLKATSRTVFNALEAPFQIATNAIGYASAKAAGKEQPNGVGIADVFTNTDIGNQVYGVQDQMNGVQDSAFADQGSGFFTDPNSPSAKMKEGLDNDLAGGMGSTIGRRVANSLDMPKDSTGYSILSGTVDAFSRVLDPTMYVGPGEVKALARTSQGIDAAAGAKALAVGTAAAHADDAIPVAKDLAGKAFDSHAAADQAAKRLTDLEQARREAQEQFGTLVAPKAADLRAQAAAHSAEVDTRLADYIGTMNEQSVEQWRQQLLDAQSVLKATEHEAATAVKASADGADTAFALRDQMLAEGHMLPEGDLPAGYKYAEPELVHVAPPTPSQLRAREGGTEWHGDPNVQPEGIDTVPLVKHAVLDQRGREVTVLYTDPENGLIEHVGTDPAHQKKGLASSLFFRAEDNAAGGGFAAPQHATHPEDLSDAGKAFAASTERARAGRSISDQDVADEAARRHETDMASYTEKHQDANDFILKHLSLPQRATYEKHGLVPLTVVRRILEEGSSGGFAAEEHLNAIIRGGTTDLERVPAELGTPWTKAEYEETAQFRPGKDKGERFVKVPWKRTKDDIATSLEDHAGSVREEADAAAREERLSRESVNVVSADDAGGVPALQTALEKVAPDLSSELSVPTGPFLQATGETPAAVIGDLASRLEQAGVNTVTRERTLYTLNDALLEHGVVVDGVPGLAPAGRGRAAAEQHALGEAHLENLQIQSDSYGQTIRQMGALADDAKAALKKLDERPIERAGKAADRANAKADTLEAKQAAALQRRLVSLQGREAKVQAIVDAHLADRDEALTAIKSLSDAAAKKAGVGAPAGGDPADHIRFLEDLAGLRTTVDGTDVASLDRGLNFLMGTDAEPLYRAVTAIHDPATIYNLTRGKLPVDMVNELAAAKTIEDARGVFVRYAGRGMVDPTTGKLMGLRIAARAAMNGVEPDRLLPAYDKAFSGAAKATKWGYAAGRRNVPWANGRHVEDAEGMTHLVSDTINYMERLWRPTRNEAGNAFHDEWVNKMLTAGSAEERRSVWYQMLDATAQRAAKAQGLSDEATEAFVGSLKASMARQRNLTSYTAEARAANGADPLTLNGQPLPKNIAMLESEMSTRVMTPDWREMRRALKSVQSLEKAAGGDPELRRAALEASDAVFDKFWRTSVLAFRGGYVLRNTADIAARMYLAGHPSLFTSPHGIVALALSHKLDPNSALGALVKRAERADVDLDGKPFEKLADEDRLYAEAIDGFNRVAARDTSLLDPGAPSRAMRLGYVPVGPDHPLFYQGWGNELGKMWASPMAADVLKLVTGNLPKGLSKHMAVTGITDRREALVDYLFSGAGKQRLDRLRDLSPALGDRLKTPDDLRAYLFGDEAASLESRWRRLTLDLDPDISKHVLNGFTEDELGTGEAVKATQSFLERRNATASFLRGAAKDRVKDPEFPVQQVNAPVWADRGAKNAFAQRAERMTDAFFTFSSHIEKELGYLPEFRYAKWDRAAQLVHALTPEDAAALAKTAEQALGGGFRGSWAKRTLSQIQSGAKRAAGDGGFTLDDLKGVTDEYGVRHIKSLFYDAQKRNALGHATRLVSPFAQAWANSLRVWTRLAVHNPRQVYKAAVLYQAGQGKGTAWLTDDPSNPDDALLYRDPTSGQTMVGIPVVGSVLAGISSLVAQAHGGQAVSGSSVGAASPVSSFNLLFQNGILPGVGPALQIPATMLDGTDQYQAWIPDWAKQQLVPLTNVDPNRDPGLLEQMVPGWAGSVFAGLGVPGFQQRVTKYVKPAMATLFSEHPERYLTKEGFLDNNGQARLLQDANALAQGLTLGKGLLQNSSAGSLMPQLYAKDRNGNNLSQVILTQEFNDLASSTGSREQAMSQLMDKYGIGPLMSMLPNREFGYTPTNQAYDFVKQNPDVADAHGSVLSLFLPGGGYSAYMDRWTRKRGTNPALDPGQMIDYSNGLLYEAQLGRLQEKLVGGQLSQDEYDKAEAQLKTDYKDVPQAQRTLNSRDVAVKEITDGLGDPRLANTEAGHAAAIYLQLRTQALAAASGGNLTGNGDAPLRAWLREQGSELTVQYPEFAVMWTKVFRGEVKD